MTKRYGDGDVYPALQRYAFAMEETPNPFASVNLTTASVVAIPCLAEFSNGTQE